MNGLKFEAARVWRCRKIHITPIIVRKLGSIFTEGGLANIFNCDISKDWVVFYHIIVMLLLHEYLFFVL